MAEQVFNLLKPRLPTEVLRGFFIQQYKEELSILLEKLERPELRELPREAKALIERYQGKPVTILDIVQAVQSGQAWAFPSHEEASEAHRLIVAICDCRDPNAVMRLPGHRIELNLNHMKQNQATDLCWGRGGPDNPTGHLNVWEEVLSTIEAQNGMEPAKMAEFLRERERLAQKFSGTEDEVKREMEKTFNAPSTGAGGIVLFRFPDAAKVLEVAERIIRLGVPGEAVSHQFGNVLALKRSDCSDHWGTIVKMADEAGTRPLGGKDLFSEWVTHHKGDEAVLVFSDDTGINKVIGKLLSEGCAADGFRVDGRRLYVRNSFLHSLIRAGEMVKETGAELETLMGNYRHS